MLLFSKNVFASANISYNHYFVIESVHTFLFVNNTVVVAYELSYSVG